MFLFGGAYAGSAFFFPAYFAEARGYGEARAATLVGLSNGVAVFGYLTAAVVGEYLLPRRTVFTLWCILGAVALTGLLWLSGSETQDLAWYGITCALFFGSQAVVATLIAEQFPIEVRATALGVCASAPLSLGFALFPLVVPYMVASLGWSGGLSIVVLPLLVGSGLVALFLPNGELPVVVYR
jgi:sugar phosphate permease